MNRRILIALAVLVPLAIFGAAKWASRFRPVLLGAVGGTHLARVQMSASESTVAVDDQKFDLKGAYSDALPNHFLGVGRWTWAWAPGYPALLFLDDGLHPVQTYALPVNIPVDEGEFAQPLVNFSPAADRVEMLVLGHYVRWRAHSRAVERHCELVTGHDNIRELAGAFALSRDGETVVFAGTASITVFSTRTGKPVRVTPLQDATLGETIEISPHGRYALYELSTHRFFKQRVVETRSGRVPWILTMDDNQTAAVFSPDETEIAVPIAKRARWEVHRLPTGEIARTLPLIPQTRGAAFAPDGDTLYSLAGDVLYRQRAR